MPNDLTPDPARFGLIRFADLLPARDHIVGEDRGCFDGFREAILPALAPMTAYEAVIAENLIAIEWELIQHRRMRDSGLRAIMRDALYKAVVARETAAHKKAADAAWAQHEEAGGADERWQRPPALDREAAEAKGIELAARAVSSDPDELAAANAEIRAMGLDVVELMGEAYRSHSDVVRHHDVKIQELERRRRDVKRDFDTLQRTRPVQIAGEAEVIEG